MRTLAILPVKSFSRAKQRLTPEFEPELRAHLAEAMLRDVLAALMATGLAGVIVVTGSAAAYDVALEHGAQILHDREEGHNAAAMLGVAETLRAGADRVLLVPGDCPALEPAEVDELLDRRPTPPHVVIVPDRHGTGTNALLISPPDALEPSFGPGSCQRHADLARAAGVSHEVRNLPSLALDIDTPDDLAALARLGDRAPLTNALLSKC